MILRTILILSLSSFSTLALAQLKDPVAQAANEKKGKEKECSAVDLTPELGEMRDQQSTGWCYAFSSADLLSYKLKKRISAFDIAITYNKGFYNDVFRNYGEVETNFKGGHPRRALEEALKKGLCLEKDLPSEDKANSEHVQTLTEIDSLSRSVRATGSRKDCQTLYGQTKAVFPNVNLMELNQILRQTVKVDIIKNLADGTCNSRIKADFQVQRITNQDPAVFEKRLDQELDKKNPVIFAFDANVLMGKDEGEEPYFHTAILAGRRYNAGTGRCEYLIRNTWGRSCVGYAPGLSCKDGNVWIPKEKMLKKTLDATFLN